MSERLALRLYNAQQGHQALRTAWDWIKPQLIGGHQITVEAKRPTRSTEQNRRMWAMLGEVSEQVTWHGQKLSPQDWKDMATAALKRQRVVPGIDGGFVVLGTSTSRMTVAEMTELMDFLEAFGAQQGVRFTHTQEAA